MKIKILLATIATALMPLTACASNNAPEPPINAEYMTINITIDGKTLTADLIDNSSAKALVEKLQQGSVTYTANDYGGFEKVGALEFSLPRNDRSITTAPGDIILYQGDNLCLYYDRNSWNFTPIGRINYENDNELRDFLKAGRGQIYVTLSLPGSSGIADIEAENSADTEYYNLDGKKTSRNAKGVLIARTGNKTTKITRK